MKKIVLAMSLFVLVSIASFAQEMSPKTNFFSLGIGPANHWGYYHNYSSPAFRLSLDHGFKEIGPGVLTFGGLLGFSAGGYKDNFNSYSFKQTWTAIAATFRTSYYYSFADLGIKGLNAYGGVGLGMRYDIFNQKYEGPNQSYYKDYYNNASGVNFLFALYFGANYFLTDKIALYTEFGYDISPFTFGVTFKL